MNIIAGGLHCARDPQGTAAIEFALLMPVLMLVLLGLADVATLASRTLQVEAAAQTGARFAVRHGWQADAIARAAGVGLATLRDGRAEPHLLKGCLQANATVTAARAQCTNGSLPGTYVEVIVSAAATPLLLLRSKRVMPDRVSGQALVRIG